MQDITAQAHTRRTLRQQMARLSDWSRVELLGREHAAVKRNVAN